MRLALQGESEEVLREGFRNRDRGFLTLPSSKTTVELLMMLLWAGSHSLLIVPSKYSKMIHLRDLLAIFLHLYLC